MFRRSTATKRPEMSRPIAPSASYTIPAREAQSIEHGCSMVDSSPRACTSSLESPSDGPIATGYSACVPPAARGRAARCPLATGAAIRQSNSPLGVQRTARV